MIMLQINKNNPGNALACIAVAWGTTETNPSKFLDPIKYKVVFNYCGYGRLIPKITNLSKHFELEIDKIGSQKYQILKKVIQQISYFWYH